MRNSKLNCLLLFLLLISPGITAGTYSHTEEKADTTQLAPDGPYLIHLQEGKTRMIAVRPRGVLVDTLFTGLTSDLSIPVYSHGAELLFHVSPHTQTRPEWQDSQPDKIFVTSDPHGDWESFSTLLQAHGVVDANWNWSYGTNHLMVIGDIFDRGDDVLPLFWLVYKLEEEAAKAGGKASFLIGNHEAMVLGNDLRYVNPKYLSLADTLQIPYPSLFDENTELGKWLGSRNLIHQIGDLLFVHAGLSEDFLQEDFSVPEVNQLFSKGLFLDKAGRNELSPRISFLYGNKGPIWYRGMVSKDEKYFPLAEDILSGLQDKYQVKKIIVGHTIFPEVSSFYDGSVIDVNVSNRKNREGDLSRALVIEKDKIYTVGNTGIKERIF